MSWAKQSNSAEVVCVLSNKKTAYVLERASLRNIPAFFVPKKKSESGLDYDEKLLVRLSFFSPDLIILAGYMKILTPHFLDSFKNRVINIHPSLLPNFPGIDGYGEAYRAQVKTSGCTIHYVDEGMDTGPIIAQKSFDLIPGESFEEFKDRGLKIENQFYPEVLEKIIQGLI